MKIRLAVGAGVFLFLGVLLSAAEASAQSAERLANRTELPPGSPLLDRPARVHIKDVSLETALLQLTEASGVPVAYSPGRLPREVRVSCLCEGLTLGHALERLLRGTSLSYLEVGSQIVVFPSGAPTIDLFPRPDPINVRVARSPKPSTEAEEMTTNKILVGSLALALSLASPPNATAQGTVSGRVVQSGTLRPLAGAQVHIPGTGMGGISNAEGRYLLLGVPPGEVTIRVQLIGFGSEERSVIVTSGQTAVADFELATEALGLDEIVVTGTAGGMQRRAVGNVVGTLDVARALERSAPPNMQQMLSGQVPGVYVLVGGGNTGSGGQIVVRGFSTEALNAQPLVYVDGIRVSGGTAGSVAGSGVSRLNDFNPEDIERIEVIKGPAAATLYGTEATNGVIQIITKKGRPGAATVNVTMQQGANWFLNAEERTATHYELLEDGSIVSLNLVRQEKERGTPIFRTGHIQSYGLNVRGGQERFTYYLSGNHEREQGFQFTNDLERTSLRTNLQLAAADNLDISAELGMVRSDGAFTSDGQASGTGAINLINGGNPLLVDTHTRGFGTGPHEVFRDIDHREKLNRAVGAVTLTHRPTAWFTQRLTAGTDWSDADRSSFTPRLPEGSPAYYGANSVGNKSLNHLRDLNHTADYNATATFELTPAVGSATTMGVQYFARENLQATATGNNMPTPAVSTVSAAAVRSGAESFEENKTFGVFLQQTMSWRNQAFVTAAMRADGNSAFGESFKAAYYPKLSGTWVVSDADFWNMSFMESLKLRAAWGKSGLQPDVFAATRTYSPVTGPEGQPAVTTGNLGNPDLKPEVGQELELGFDASFFRNRVTAEVTHYRQRTTDLIVQELVAPSQGFSGPRYVNIGEVSNNGYEVRLEVHPVMSEGLDIGLTLSASHNRNRLVDLAGRQIQADTRGRWQHVEGYQLGSMWTKLIASAEWREGLVPGQVTAQDLINVTCKGPAEENFRPMPCVDAPFHFFDNPGPGWQGSFSNNIAFGSRLSIDALWVFVTDRWRFNTSKGDGINGRTLLSMDLRRGTADPMLAASIVTPDVEHHNYERDDYLRLRDISVSYTLPSGWVEGFGMSRASFTVSGRNLVTVTHPSLSKERSPDPEARQTRGSMQFAGWEQTRVPLPASVVTTIRMTF